MRIIFLSITMLLVFGSIKAQNLTLPFTIKVAAEKIDNLPDYIGPNNQVGMDFPYNPLMIDNEYWIIYRNGYHGPVMRYKGTNIENAVRQADGTVDFPAFLRAQLYIIA